VRGRKSPPRDRRLHLLFATSMLSPGELERDEGAPMELFDVIWFSRGTAEWRSGAAP